MVTFPPSNVLTCIFIPLLKIEIYIVGELMKVFKSILVLALVLGVLGVSGCVSDNETSSDSIKTFKNTYMAFNYPKDRTIKEYPNKQMIELSKNGSNTVTVDFYYSKVRWQESLDFRVERSEKGIQTLTNNNVTYMYVKAKTTDGQSVISYFFEKNGKFFSVSGQPGDEDVMNIIAQSIQ